MILPSSLFLETHCPIDDLFSAELHHMPRPDYLPRFHDGSLDCNARQRAVSWILKAVTLILRSSRQYVSYYSSLFLRVGACVLPVSPRDGVPRRQLSRQVPLFAGAAGMYRVSFSLWCLRHGDGEMKDHRLPQRGLGWPWQLLSVACLSVAAKIEETHVPLLLDLQVQDPVCVFEPRTVRRMELLLMTALHWRMRSVTPLDFVGYFCSMLGAREDCQPLLRRATNLILASHRGTEACLWMRD